MKEIMTSSVTKNEMPVGDLNVYLAGGCGANIGKVLQQAIEQYATSRIARIRLIYVDTSASNLAGVKSPDVYLLKDVDGSGKVRAENSQLISNKCLDILQKFPPAFMNVVVSSLSGGSGSVISPLLMREIQQQDGLVIAIGVASTGSAIEVNNSINTLKTYQAISKKTEKPVVLISHLNKSVVEHANVNKAVVNEIILTALVSSRQNLGLDSADLRSWLVFNKVSNAPIGLVGMEFRDTADVSSPDLIPITAVSVGREGVDVSFKDVDHQSTGIIPDDSVSSVTADKPVHAVVVDGPPQILVKKLQEIQKEMEGKSRSRVYSSSILEAGDEDQDGLVL